MALRLLVVAVALLLPGCGPGMGGGPAPCRDGDVAEACDDTFCEAPVVRLARGDGPDRFELLSDGATATVHFGCQGAYHLDGAVETEGLCSVVFVRFRLLVAPSAEEEHVEIWNQEQHVQALRCDRLVDTGAGGLTAEDCAARPSLQRWWGARLAFHCAYWPDDPVFNPICPEEPVAFIEELHVLLETTVRDHDGREASQTVRIKPEYTPMKSCNGSPPPAPPISI